MQEMAQIRTKIDEILEAGNIEESQQQLMQLIPELKSIVGFEHRHPHHHLDVWGHTLLAIKNVKSKDKEVLMALLLHDIGKPFSYQDEEVRHFHGHPEVSAQMTEEILTRLEYDEEFVQDVSYLVRTHDTRIDPNNLDNSNDMVRKRLQIQYADARAHAPSKVEKRIKFLDDIARQLQQKEAERE